MHEEWEQGEGGEDDDTGDPPRIWLRHKALPGCAFTRSIGDAVGEQVGVFARPEVLVKDLTENDKYVLIASDGVWEFLTNQTVIKMVASYKSPLKACKAVVNEAYKLWLQYDVRTDDITMIAIYLEDTGGLARAHAEAMAAAVAAEEKTTPPGSLRASMTLRRSSLVLREQLRSASR
jgi:serine/threonine protein phosphatase PrpC